MTEERDLATVELLGALTYGQLRSFEVSAAAVRHAPDARAADQLADYAVHEHEAYALLRDALVERTDLAAAVMDKQKARFDAYFDAAPIQDWLGACTFFAVGLPMAADFTREIAPTLEPHAADVVVRALARREEFERFAVAQVRRRIEGDDDERERARHLVADTLGRALTEFQGALTETDALKILLTSAAEASGESGEALVRRVAITVLENHRRRMHELGLEDLE